MREAMITKSERDMKLANTLAGSKKQSMSRASDLDEVESAGR